MATEDKAIHRITDPIDTIRATMTDPQLALSTTADATRNVNVGTMVHRLDDDFYTNVHNTKIDANTGVSTLQTFKAADGVEDDDVATVGQLGFVGSGICANRPTVSTVGVMYFDTNKGFPTWWNGTTWVNATGAEVLCSTTATFKLKYTYTDATPDTVIPLDGTTVVTLADASNIAGDGTTLESITFGSNMLTIGVNAFNGTNTSAFKNVNVELAIPQTITSIEEYAFSRWLNMDSPTTISNNVTALSQFAFNEWSAFSSTVTLPDGLVTISDRCFNQWYLINTEIIVPITLESIGEYAFFGLNAYNQQLILPQSLVSISYKSFGLLASMNTAFTIPSSVTTIGDFAFERWDSMVQAFTFDHTSPSGITFGTDMFGGWFGFNGGAKIETGGGTNLEWKNAFLSGGTGGDGSIYSINGILWGDIV